MRVSALLRLYPRAWRARYGEEMLALLDDRPHGARDRVDLVRGALDAWLHPWTPSAVPIVAAFAGGGLWTLVAIAVLAQPVPLDWPGYLFEIVPLALIGAGCLLAAVVACLLRAAALSGRLFGAIAAATAIAYVAWIAALAGTLLGLLGGPQLAAAQTAAVLASIAVGLTLVRAGDEPIGMLLVVAGAAMLVPWTVTWLVVGVAWTAIGVALFVDRSVRLGHGDLIGPASS
jgi:hypothetical protein